MKNNYNHNRFSLTTLAVAVLASLPMSSVFSLAHAEQNTTQEQNSTQEQNTAQEQSTDDSTAMEEVVVKASRLKGTASAVLQERRNQAFVADILGAEQIARTGDSDAAAALKRVTGLTLVDGKFIYVRGLGERYSSTQLNGAAVPSPDPTRTVIPLDLFPSAIIESLSVQKSYSPSMPAHFGGGNVDIRLKTIPKDFIFNVAGNIGGNSENSSKGLGYNGGGNDWRGKDDGTRAAPAALTQLWQSHSPLNELSQQDNRVIASQLNRDYDPKDLTINPDTGIDLTLGDRFDFNNSWQVNIRGRYYDDRSTVQTNELKKIKAFITLDANISYRFSTYKNSKISLAITNLFDQQYFHPGLRSASANNSNVGEVNNNGVWLGSQSFYNSKIPQPGREISLSWYYQW